MTSDELLQLYQELTIEEQRKFIAKLDKAKCAQPPTEASKESDSRTPDNNPDDSQPSPKKSVACPYCHSKARHHGYSKLGRARYLCGNCHKSFSDTTGTVLQHTLKPSDTWKKFFRCTLECKSLRASAKECGISTGTAFLWRHKILDVLQAMMDTVKFDGIIEIDEAFFRLSFKGDHKNSSFKMPRLPHHRGNDNHTRGLSSELVCVPTAVTGNGLSVGKISNLGSLKQEGLLTIYKSHIEEHSTICTDSHKAYRFLAAMFKVHHVPVDPGKHMKGKLGIQCVNSYHSRLKSMIAGRFHGVATKYLNNYIVLYNFAGHAKGSIDEKMEILDNFIKTTQCETRCYSLANRSPVPTLA